MSGGFNNPLVGGSGGLVYPSIHSPNFVHNVSGWTINKDGTAEFQNIIARGDISATSLTTTRMTVDANGNMNFFNAFGAVVMRLDAQKDAIYLYTDNGSAVQGDLVQVHSVVPGVDPIQGDSYDAGIVSFGFLRTLKAVMASASLVLTKLSGAAAPPSIQIQDNVLNNSVSLGSVQLSFFPNGAVTIIRSQEAADTGSRYTIDDSGTHNWGPGTPATDTTLYRSGVGTLASDPIQGNLAGVGETPHSMSVRGYQNGWLDGGRQPGRYRIIASPPSTVELYGSLTIPVGFAVGQVIVNLPLAYHPTNPQTILGRNLSVAGALAALDYAAGGNLTWQGATAASAAGNIIDFHGFAAL